MDSLFDGIHATELLFDEAVDEGSCRCIGFSHVDSSLAEELLQSRVAVVIVETFIGIPTNVRYVSANRTNACIFDCNTNL